MKIFLDTSSLIKLYHREAGTPELESFFSTKNVTEIFQLATAISVNPNVEIFITADRLLKSLFEKEGLGTIL